MANFETKIKPSLLEKHGNMSNEEVEVFRRKWEVGVLLRWMDFKLRSLLTMITVLLHVLRGRFSQQDTR